MELYKKTVDYIDKKNGQPKRFVKAVCEVEINGKNYIVDLDIKQGGIVREILLSKLPEYSGKGV